MDMTVDEAFKMIFTLGVITPEWQPKPRESAESCAAATPSVTSCGFAWRAGPGPVPAPLSDGISPCPCAPITAATSTSAWSVPRSPSPAGCTAAVTTAA